MWKTEYIVMEDRCSLHLESACDHVNMAMTIVNYNIVTYLKNT